tara:strand:+ start:40 stop:780 length:741 start_codon:yes stop_codon:yes gene_type:complete
MVEKVNFGLSKVPKKEKDKMVTDLFTSVSEKYDLMNDLMSFGIHRLWKDKMVKICSPQNGFNILDIAVGSGDIALRLLRKNKNISLTCLDNNQKMLEICRKKLIDKGYIKNIEFVLSSAENLSLKENQFDLATIAFGMRNFTDYSQALQSIYKVLKPGGKLVIMEFCNPRNKYYRELFEKYTFNIIPKLGELVANDYENYNYLAESIKSYPTPSKITAMMNNSQYINTRHIYLLGDIVTIHIGFKN